MTWHFPHMVRAVTGDTEIDYDAIADREILDAAWPVAGVVGAGDWKVTQHAAGPNLTVDVAAGKGLIPCIGIANGGKYLAFNDGTLNVDMGSPPSAGQFRIDSVIVHQYDRLVDANSGVDSAGYMPLLEVVNGPVAGSAGAATAPALPVGIAGTTVAGYLEIARVLRTGGESSVVNSAITDCRPLAVGNADRTVGRYRNTTPSGTVSGSETSIGSGYSLQAVVNAGRRYRLIWSGETNATSAGAIPAQVSANVSIRTGTTAGAGTLLADKLHNILVNGGPGQDTWGFTEDIAPGTFSTGPVTLQTFLRQSAGTGGGLSMVAARMSLVDIGS